MSERNKPETHTYVEEVEFCGLEEVSEATPTEVIGMVTGCRQLNIRKEPRLDADVLCYVPVNSELAINTAESTDEWLRVFTATGVEGYCMSKYVFIKQ